MDDVLVEIALPNGHVMLAAVTRADPGGPEDVGLGHPKSCDVVAEALQGIGTAVLGAMEKMKPSKASIEFGLELAIKGGNLVSVFVNADTKAALKVVLEWERGHEGE